LKGFIGENIRLIDGIIQYATQHNVPGLLLFMDFEKAFDSLEWPFILDTLRFFGFGPSIIKWIKKPFTVKLIAGQVTSSGLKEVLGRAVPFRHIYLFWQQRCWPRQSGVQ